MFRRKRQREAPLQFTFEPPPPPSKKERTPRRRRIRWLRLLTVVWLLGLLAIVSAFFGFMTAIAQELPSLDQYGKGRAPDQVGYIYAKNGYDRNGKPVWVRIATLSSADSRILVKPNEISPVMKEAIVAIEDRRFYQHRGVDPEGIVRAVFRRYQSGSQEGGSTITQQFIKNTFLTPEQSLQRKIKEAALAWQLEQRWSKDKILSEYLNTIYFGHGAYGVESAARYYFGKHASQLDAGEAALLAAIPKSPTRYDPITNPKEAKERRDLVLDKMVQQGDLTPEAAAIEKDSRLLEKGWEPHHERGSTIQPYFVEYVEQELINHFGTARTFGGGLRVYTTLDLKEQKLAEDAVRQTIAGKGPDAALVAIDPKTGGVTAMAQSTPYAGGPNGHQFNDVTDGHRQPGSAFKPFVLAAALQRGIQTSTYFLSKRLTFDIGDGTTWSPKSNSFWGSGERYAHLRATTWQDDTRTWSTPTEGLVGGAGVPHLGVSCTATSTVAFTSGQGLPGAAPATEQPACVCNAHASRGNHSSPAGRCETVYPHLEHRSVPRVPRPRSIRPAPGTRRLASDGWVRDAPRNACW